MKFEDYHYKVAWSEEDEAFIGRTAEFTYLVAHGDTEAEAFKEIRFVVKVVLELLKERGEQPPQPLKPFSKEAL